jgi:xanthine dehydrogenase FAD-binding subunit
VKAMLPKFDYLAPETLQETLELLDELGRDAKLLAGGTDLLVNMRARVEHPKKVIDIKKVKDLQELSYEEKRGLTIGAGVSLNRLIQNKNVTQIYPIIDEAAHTIADFQVRNRATLVGNICNASPAADTAPALLVLNATVNIASRKGARKVPINEFFTGVKKTVLAANEIVTSVNVPSPPPASRGGYLKARRTLGEDVAIVGVGGLLIPNSKSTPEFRIAYASVAPTPVRALEAEKVFQSKESAHRLVEEAMPIIMKAVSPISDVRSGKEYRANLVKILTHRLVNKLWEAS